MVISKNIFSGTAIYSPDAMPFLAKKGGFVSQIMTSRQIKIQPDSQKISLVESMNAWVVIVLVINP
jgi:hypothetical protein